MRIFFLLLLIPAYCFSQIDESVFTQKLDNGLTCIVIENPVVPLVNIEWVVKGGTDYEPAARKGFTQLLTQLFFSANKDYPSAEEAANRIKQIGGVTGTSVSNEHGSVYLTCSKRNIDNALKIFLSAVRQPLFVSEEVDSALSVLLSNAAQIQGDPNFMLDEALNKNLWAEKPAQMKSSLITSAIGRYASPENLAVFQKLFFSPNNSCIIVSGDVQHKDVFQKLVTVFGPLPRNPQMPTDVYQPYEFSSLNLSSQFVMEDAQVQSPLLVISFPVDDIRVNPYAAHIGEFLEALVNASSSSLNKNLFNAGLADQVSARYRQMKFGSSFEFIIAPRIDKLGECYTQARKEIEALANFGSYTSDQLKQASQLMYSTYAYKTENAIALSHYIGEQWAKTDKVPALNIDDELKRMQSLNEVINFCQLNFLQRNMTAGLLISTQQKNSYNINATFTQTFSVDAYQISFTRNDDQVFDLQNKEQVNSFSQLLKINPQLKIELIAEQDAAERKETAKARFLSVYKSLSSSGVPEEVLDAMTVSLYIRHAESDEEMHNNMIVHFKIAAQ